MTQQSRLTEPTNVQRAQWARKALAVFTAETYSGDHPDTMHPEDLETAIGDLICDLLHVARYHPRMDALAIDSHALNMFEQELAEEKKGTPSAESPAEWIEALLNIKRMAGKSGDHEADPFALLDLISDEVRRVLAKSTRKKKRLHR
jgi:hypothetical protein